MGFWFWFWFAVAGLIGLGILYVSLLTKGLSEADKAYKDALSALEDDPNNAALWKAALEKGRTRAEFIRLMAQNDKDSTVVVFDETALPNDIEAATAGRPVALSHADEIKKLAALKADGVISHDELESLKSKLMTKPSGVQDAIRLLRGLKDLEKEGALTENEFKMKKWDVLSRKILQD